MQDHMQLQSILIEDDSMESKHISVTVVHGTEHYRVVGEKGRYITVYPEREMPDHPGSRYPWPVGIPWTHTAASHAVSMYRQHNGHVF